MSKGRFRENALPRSLRRKVDFIVAQTRREEAILRRRGGAWADLVRSMRATEQRRVDAP